jgi:cystinosin
MGLLSLLDHILLSSGIPVSGTFVYDELILNFRRKSVVGLSVDFVVLNVLHFLCLSNCKVLGFSFYSIYNILFFSSKEIHEEYHRRHPRSSVGPLVQANDVFFAVHAAVISIFTLTQIYCWGYTRSPRQLPSPWTWGIVIGGSLAVAVLSCIVVASHGEVIEWIDVCYALSYIKLLCTFVKYVPQVIFSFIRLTGGRV